MVDVEPHAVDVRVLYTNAGSMLEVCLKTGQRVLFSVSKYPRLANARHEDLRDVRILHDGSSLRWEKLDEDLSVRKLVQDHGARHA